MTAWPSAARWAAPSGGQSARRSAARSARRSSARVPLRPATRTAHGSPAAPSLAVRVSPSHRPYYWAAHNCHRWQHNDREQAPPHRLPSRSHKWSPCYRCRRVWAASLGVQRFASFLAVEFGFAFFFGVRALGAPAPPGPIRRATRAIERLRVFRAPREKRRSTGRTYTTKHNYHGASLSHRGFWSAPRRLMITVVGWPRSLRNWAVTSAACIWGGVSGRGSRLIFPSAVLRRP